MTAQLVPIADLVVSLAHAGDLRSVEADVVKLEERILTVSDADAPATALALVDAAFLLDTKYGKRAACDRVLAVFARLMPRFGSAMATSNDERWAAVRERLAGASDPAPKTTGSALAAGKSRGVSIGGARRRP